MYKEIDEITKTWDKDTVQKLVDLFYSIMDELNNDWADWVNGQDSVPWEDDVEDFKDRQERWYKHE